MKTRLIDVCSWILEKPLTMKYCCLRLWKYGVIQIEITWIKSYLTGHKQYCYLGGKYSKKQEVTCIIPQGSCLGPLLFSLYMNDFEKSLSTFYPKMHADATSIYSISESPKQGVRENHGLARENRLSLNLAKCEYMFLGNEKQLSKLSEISNIKIDKDENKRANQIKYLGVTIEGSLSWNQQYKLIKEN